MGCTCEGKQLPEIRWHEGMEVPLPEGHVPDYVDVGMGRTIDEARLYWILDALLAEHPDAERIRGDAGTNPGLNLERHDEHMLCVVLAATGEAVGMFDDRLLAA